MNNEEKILSILEQMQGQMNTMNDRLGNLEKDVARSSKARQSWNRARLRFGRNWTSSRRTRLSPGKPPTPCWTGPKKPRCRSGSPFTTRKPKLAHYFPSFAHSWQSEFHLLRDPLNLFEFLVIYLLRIRGIKTSRIRPLSILEEHIGDVTEMIIKKPPSPAWAGKNGKTVVKL